MTDSSHVDGLSTMVDTVGGLSDALSVMAEGLDSVAADSAQHLLTAGMYEADYVCCGDHDLALCRHFALNFDMYTHFTSPIRRYADVVVHRQLRAALARDADAGCDVPGDMGKVLEQEYVSGAAKQCNIRREKVKNAQEGSLKLFMWMYLKQRLWKKVS